MQTKFAVVGSNLVVPYKEIKLFAQLHQVYPQDFVDFLLRNYFRLLDDIFHKWLENFHIKSFMIRLIVLMKILNSSFKIQAEL